MSETPFACPNCGHVDNGFAHDPSKVIARCNECESRISFGVLQPRVVIAPPADGDRRWLEVHFDGTVYKLDALFAMDVANEILSLRSRAEQLAATLPPVVENGLVAS